MAITTWGPIPAYVNPATAAAQAVQAVSVTPGTVRYVDSVNGNAGNSGFAPDQALVTADAANNASAAGDTIILLEKHAESLANATSLVLDTAGIRVIGIGIGSRRPTFTFTATGSNIPIAGLDVLLQNVVLTISGTTDVTIGITVTGNGVILQDVELIEPTTTDQFVVGIHATTMIGGKILDCKFYGLAGDATVTAIRITNSARLEIAGCRLVGDFQGSEDATGAIQSLTTLNVDIDIHHNRVENRDGTSEAGIVFVATDTGFVWENFIAVPTSDWGQGIISDTAMRQYNNFVVDVAAERGAPEGTPSA